MNHDYQYLKTIMLAVFLVIFASSALAQPGVVRVLPSSANPSAPITIFLNVTVNNTYGIEEFVPANWTSVSTTYSGCNVTNNFSLSDSTTVSRLSCQGAASGNFLINYTATPPGLGSYQFSGRYSIDDMGLTQAITSGNNQITIGQSSATLIDIQNNAFNPSTITVAKGATIRFTNKDSVPHTATSDTGIFDTGILSQGQSKDITFNTAGTFAYHCTVHPGMTANIIVTDPNPVNNAPTIPALTGSSSGTENNAVSFSASSTDPDNNQIKYEWDWNNDNIVDETSQLINSGAINQRSHIFSASGTYTVKVRAVDSLGSASSFAQSSVVVSIASQQLSVNLNNSYSGLANSSIQFAPVVSGGVDPYTYSWNFGDGQSSSLQNPSHLYNTVGSYTIQLVVTDSSSNSKTAVSTASISSPVNTSAINIDSLGNVSRILPSSVAAGSVASVILSINVGNASAYTIEETLPVSWSVLAISTPSGTLSSTLSSSNQITIRIANLGASSGLIIYNVSVPSNTSLGSNHLFSGTYQMINSVSSTGVKSTIGSNSTNIGTVADFSISTLPVSASIQRGSTSSILAAITSINAYTNTISLLSPNAPNGVFLTFSPQTGSQTFLSTIIVNASSTAQLGTYPITIRGTGSDGRSRDSIYTITITDPLAVQPLSVSISSPYSSPVNSSTQFSSSVSGGIPPYTFNWTFGDAASSSLQNPLHVYNAEGNYSVSLLVKDSSGNIAANSTNIVITSTPKTTLIIDTTPVKGSITLNGVLKGTAPLVLLLDKGLYNISYSSITNYTKPSAESINLTQNQTINRTYTISQIALCGDGICNSGETTSSCSTDCGSSQCIASISFKDANNLNLSATCLSANQMLSWNINDQATFPITAVVITPKTALTGNKISIVKVLGSGLANPYMYFNFTSSINDTSISSATISFAVRNSFISSNKIDVNTISLYRYTTQWNPLTTVKIRDDGNYTYYQAATPGFSLFGISGRKSECSACSPPTQWSVCDSGKQARTNYICDQDSVTCVAKSEIQSCCPVCPSSIENPCSNGASTKETYSCGPETNYVCAKSVQTISCVSSSDAQAAIDSARLAISNADKLDKNTTAAKELLIKAEAAFSVNDFQNAKQLATEAAVLANSAPLLAHPFFLPIPFEIFVAIIIAASASAAGFLFWKKRSGATCTVCKSPTAMKFLCCVCNGHVCFKDSKIYQGKVYCSKCFAQISGKPLPNQKSFHDKLKEYYGKM